MSSSSKDARRRNIFLTLAFTTVTGLASGVYGFSTMSGYLYTLTDSTTLVGLAEGVQGVVQCCVSVPAGLFVDRTKSVGRASVLRIAGYIGLFSAVFISVALMCPPNSVEDEVDSFGKYKRFTFVTVGLGFLGAYQGAWSTSLYTIYADSVPSGKRSRYQTYQFISRVISSVVGPALAIILYAFLGDNWSLVTQRNVFVVGLAMLALATIFLFNFVDIVDDDEDDDVDEEEEENDARKKHIALGGDDEGGNKDGDDADVALLGSKTTPSCGQVACTSCCRIVGCGYLPISPRYIPHLLCLTDIIFGIASGMTIKFFPLFFRKEVGLSPVNICLIYISTYVLMSILSRVAQMISKRVGRVQTISSFGCAGIICLYTMSVVKVWWTHPIKISFLYVVRTALINCCSPLRKSILMDFTKKNERGFWNSIDGVTRFGWSGSAFLGGYLVDLYGYGYTFLITAVLQTFALSLNFWILPVVSMELSPSLLKQKGTLAAAPSSSKIEEGGRLSRPLLASSGKEQG